MRYPEFLKENGRVGFIAPSFGCTLEPYYSLFDSTISRFKDNGYEVVLGPNCYKEDGIGKSTTPENCAKEINDFFINDRSDVIISCGGGETMCEDLPYVDFEKIACSTPKWYMGYSDNTNLTFLLNTLCDTASVYGPNAPTLGEEPVQKYASDALDIIKGKRNVVTNYTEWYLPVSREEIEAEENIHEGSSVDEQIVCFKEKYYKVMPYSQKIYQGNIEAVGADFSGRLIGGCMDCLSNLVGTGFDKVSSFNERYKEDGIIWFLEACDLNVMSIRRALWHMEQAGWFKYCKGFLIGRPLMYNDTFGDFDHIEAVTGILGKFNVPIVLDIDLGHLSPAMPIVSGALGKIKAGNNNISIEYTYE